MAKSRLRLRYRRRRQAAIMEALHGGLGGTLSRNPLRRGSAGGIECSERGRRPRAAEAAYRARGAEAAADARPRHRRCPRPWLHAGDGIREGSRDERTRCRSGAAGHRGGQKPRSAAAQMWAAQERGAAAGAADGDGGRAGERSRDSGGSRAARPGTNQSRVPLLPAAVAVLPGLDVPHLPAGVAASRSRHRPSRSASRSSPIDRTGRRSAPLEGSPRGRRRVVVTLIPRWNPDVRSRCGADAGGRES